jgi:threonine dehydrogenase-like Zn-dependent dehydrogenase
LRGRRRSPPALFLKQDGLTMKALVWVAPGTMEMRDEPEPKAGPGEVVIDVAYAGICGSELGGYLGQNALRVPPLVMGHEFAGTVVERGTNLADGPAVGQAVTVNPLLACGVCDSCRRGLPHLCLKRALIGAHRPGAFADFVSVPASAIVELPANIDLRHGAIAEPVAVGVRIGVLAGDVAGRSALVLGAGPIGLVALQALKNHGADPVFIADLDAERVALSEQMGGQAVPGGDDLVAAVRAATDGVGVAVSVDAVGTAGTRDACVKATRAAGTMILSGLHEETSAFPAADVIRREIVAKGAFSYTPADFREALAAIAEDKMGLDVGMVEAPLGDGGYWFDRLVKTPGAVSKVLLKP